VDRPALAFGEGAPGWRDVASPQPPPSWGAVELLRSMNDRPSHSLKTVRQVALSRPNILSRHVFILPLHYWRLPSRQTVARVAGAYRESLQSKSKSKKRG
jgi:hypothetical protein